MKMKSMIAATAFWVVSAAAAQADCTNEVPVTSLTNAFPAYEVLTNAMLKCGNFEPNLDKDYHLKTFDAFAANPAIYTMASVTNATLPPLVDAGLIRPLDELVAKYGQGLRENQLVRINGEIVAISSIVNTPHLMYREDILNDLGIDVPTTWDELIAAAEKIKDAGVVDYPYSSYYKPGWNLGFVFINHYLGEGGEFFTADGEAQIDREKAATVLNRMKTLSTLMDPEYLVADSTFVTKQLQQGKIALATLWASRAAAVNDPKESSFSGKIVMDAALKGTERTASTLWWDGWVIGKNVTDEEAEAGFKLVMEALKPENIKANNDVAIWLANGFVPGAAAVGAIKTAEADTPTYPGTKEMSIMHTALGNGLAKFLTDQEDMETALTAIEAAYTTSAKEAGLLK